MEHRQGRRETVRLPVMLYNGHTPPMEAQIVSLSAGGAFVRLPAMARPLGAVVRLRFRLSPESGESFEWSALIVRDAADGVGVVFAQRHDRAFGQFVGKRDVETLPRAARRPRPASAPRRRSGETLAASGRAAD